jgi:hypothetical protein
LQEFEIGSRKISHRVEVSFRNRFPCREHGVPERFCIDACHGYSGFEVSAAARADLLRPALRFFAS